MEAIVFCGIQASGKSSFYRQRFFDTHLRISLDLVKTRHREDALMYACLAAKLPFVIDNTNPLPETRARYLRLAHAAGFRCCLYYFESTSADAIRRNAARTGRFRVPDPAILGTHAKLIPPTIAEGFDAAYKVCLTDSGEFDVQELI
jgi:predicted kinase